MRKVIFYILSGTVAVLSCTDNHILPSPEEQEDVAGTGIAFEASVVTSKMATRSDGSIINRLEIEFPGPGTTYYEYAGEGVAPTQKTVDYGIGIYGAYTGQYTWHELQTLATTSFADRASLSVAFPSLSGLGDEDEREFSVMKNNILNDYYTANLFYNQKAAIGAPVGTKVDKVSRSNPLTYTPERFWPNNKLDGSSTNYERATFWAYYPWNAAGNPGEYGVHIVSNENGVTTGGGMGKVQYTMHPDASQQSDFMLSELVADCSKDTYPLQVSTDPADKGFTPKRVPFKFHHMLAQVRLYAFIQGRDRVVYKDEDSDGEDDLADATWFDTQTTDATIVDDLGNVYEKTGADEVKRRKYGSTTEYDKTLTRAEFLALGLKVPDESKSIRWYRNAAIRNITDDRYRAEISYEMAFNNIHTSATFSPTVTWDGTKYTTKANYTTEGTLGSATVNHYIMNPYWFRFKPAINAMTGQADPEYGKRVMLNENYMFDYFEDTPAWKTTSMTTAEQTAALAQDGLNWATFRSGAKNVLGYTGSTDLSGNTALEVLDSRNSKHYNYPPGNIILAVPQVMDDNDVPNITITAHGYQANADGSKSSTKLTAKVTINMLQMNLKWESGFIYCYAFLDELRPGDDIVRGPETITVIFDHSRITDQW